MPRQIKGDTDLAEAKAKRSTVDKVKLLYDRVLVRRLKADEYKGCIVIPGTARKASPYAMVCAIGCGHRQDDGKFAPLLVAPGDRIVLGQYSGNPTELDGEEYWIIKEAEVLMVMPKVPEQ